jgi:Fe-S cluster assembly ATP-binding protein
MFRRRKKRARVFQMAVLEPKLAILNIDALKVVSNGVKKLPRADYTQLVITHDQQLLTWKLPNRSRAS